MDPNYLGIWLTREGSKPFEMLTPPDETGECEVTDPKTGETVRMQFSDLYDPFFHEHTERRFERMDKLITHLSQTLIRK